jgi:hypothetical protein
MTYAGAIAGIKTAIAGVTGIKKVINGLPTSPQNLPLCYLEASSGERSQAGQLTANKYRVIATVCVPWQDNTLAEDQIAPFINTVPAAIDANPALSGAVNLAKVTEWRTDVRAIAETQCRVIDFTIEVLDKAPYRTAGF